MHGVTKFVSSVIIAKADEDLRKFLHKHSGVPRLRLHACMYAAVTVFQTMITYQDFTF